MSLQAMSWALDLSDATGSDRLVLIVMCHHTDEAGFCGLSRATLADETRCSESTAHRSQQSIERLGEIEPVAAADAPSWWLGIPANRRPKLYRMVGFLGSQYATPVRRRGGSRSASPAGGSLGGRRGVAGDHDPPSDQELRDVNREQRTENSSAPRSETLKPDPDCVSCQGRGTLYRGGDASHGPFDVPCYCCDPRSFVANDGLREDIDA